MPPSTVGDDDERRDTDSILLEAVADAADRQTGIMARRASFSGSSSLRSPESPTAGSRGRSTAMPYLVCSSPRNEVIDRR